MRQAGCKPGGRRRAQAKHHTKGTQTMKHTHETQAASIGKPVNDRNAEYAIGWELYCNGLDESECVNEYQRQGWDEAKFNKAQRTAPKGAYATDLLDKTDDDIANMVAAAYHYNDPEGDSYMAFLFASRKAQRIGAKERGEAIKPVEAPDALTDRKWAQNYGKRDGENGECFFPEQVGAWLRLDYAEGYAMAQPEHETCKWWLAREYRRLVAEEAEMNWRETIIHAGGRFIGGSLEPAEVSA